jgi:hypothetical protein
VEIQLIGWRFHFRRNRHLSPILQALLAFFIFDAFARFLAGEKPKSVGPVGANWLFAHFQKRCKNARVKARQK